MPRWLRRAAGAEVESFLVQADFPAARTQQTLSQILVRHLLSRFQTDSTEEDEQTGRRTLFACAAAAIPPIFVAVMLYPAYHPIAMPPVHRPYWSQVSDEYLYVLYVFVTMSVAAILLWETIFPDLLDVFALGVLPLSPRLLQRSRSRAVACLFGMVLLCVSAPGTLLLPAVAENANFLRHLAAHGIATCAAGLCACASLLAVQALLEITLGTRRAKRFMPALQAGALLVIFLMLGSTPGLLDGLQRGAPDGRIPPVWFLAVYEQVKGGAPSHLPWTALAWRGWLAVALALSAAALTYSRAYHRRTLFLVESGNAAVPGFRVPGTIIRRVHQHLVQAPGARATFHLIAQTAFRVSKLRTNLVIHVGIGLAVLLATSVHEPGRAVSIVCCAVVLGCTAMLQSQVMPRSAWISEILPKPQDEAYALGSKLLITLWTTLFTLFVLLFFAAKHHDGIAQSRDLFVAFGAAVVVPSALTTVFMLGDRLFPFTEEREATPERFVLVFLRNVVVLPGGVVAFGWVAAKASSSTGGVLLWISAMCSIALGIRQLAAHVATRASTAEHGEESGGT